MDDDRRGSGSELGRIQLGQFGEIVITDDGHTDWDTNVTLHVEDANGDQHVAASGRCKPTTSLREDMGDEEFVNMLDRLGQSPTQTTGGHVPYSAPSPFKCTVCNKTWPGSKNNGEDVCPNCD